MAFSKTLTLLRRQNPNSFVSSSNLSYLHKPQNLSSVLPRGLWLSPKSSYISRPEYASSEEQKKERNKKPLVDFFKEAVGLSPKTEDSDDESGTVVSDLGRKLKQLEAEIRSLTDKDKILKQDNVLVAEEKKDVKPAKLSLSAVFLNKTKESRQLNLRKDAPVEKDEQSIDKTVRKKDSLENRRKEAPILMKELSPDMEVFIRHLVKEGYFTGANFVKNGSLDIGCFDDSYSRDYVKFAAEKFGKDHQEIAKWLSGTELKKVALFGCPSKARKNVFAAKKMRLFFSIPENTVCSKCVLSGSCKFVNQSVWRSDKNNLNLASVMRVITLYALELVPPQLTLTDELKMTVNRLLKDILNLSQTTALVRSET